MKLDKNVNVDDQTQQRIQRVARLPEPYLTALEQITDELSKDLMNRLVQTMYVDDLCTRFEKAIEEGKTVEEVVGEDIPAFVKEYQKEVDYRESKPSDVNQNTNALLLIDFASYVGMGALLGPCATLVNNSSEFQGGDTIALVIGVVVLAVSFFFKFKQYKKSRTNLLVLPIQIAIFLLVCYFMHFTMISSLIVFIAFIVTDLGAAILPKTK